MSEQEHMKLKDLEIETLSDDDLESVSGGMAIENSGTGTCNGGTNTGTGTCNGGNNSGTGTCNPE